MPNLFDDFDLDVRKTIVITNPQNVITANSNYCMTASCNPTCQTCGHGCTTNTMVASLCSSCGGQSPGLPCQSGK